MEIFKGRPMAVVGLLTLTASAAVYFGGTWIAFAIAATAVLTVLTAFFLFRRGKLGMFRLICAAVLTVALLSVSASSACFSEVRLKKAASLCGSDKEVTGTVIKRKTSTGYSSSFRIRITSVDNERPENGFEAELYCEYPSDLQPGFEFHLTGADIVPIDEAFGEYAGNYVADGIFLSVTSYSGTDCTVTGEENDTYGIVLTKLNSYLSRILTDKVGGDEGGLAAAMLLRNTDGITANVRRDFNRAGVSHLLAVSGLHMSVMTGILAWILARLGLHRSLSTVFLAGFALAYLAVLGFPFSAIRSVIMLFIVYGVYFAGFDTDGMNSLGIALTLICVVSPAAFLDTGFVLSFCATAGIVSVMPVYSEAATKIDNRRTKKRVINERQKRREISRLAAVDPVEAEKKKKSFRKEKKIRRHIRNSARSVRDRIAGAVLVTVSAQMLTLLPMSMYSGTLSRALLPANILLCPLGAVVLFLAALFLPFASVPYISGFLAYYLRGAASLLLSASAAISEKKNISVSLFTPFASGLIIAATLITVILMTVRLRYRFAALAPSLCVILILCFTPLSWISGGAEVRYICDREKKNDALTVCDGKYGVFAAEMSTGSYAFLSDVYEDTVKKGHTEIETLMLTHYHIRHEAAVEKFMNSQRVRKLLLPRPVTEGDLEVFWKLYDAAQRCGTECLMYDSGEIIEFCPGISVECSGPVRIGRSTHPVFSVSVCVGNDNYSLPDNDSEYRITVLGASAWDDTSGAAVRSGREADCLIIGMHGPVCKTVPAFELTDPRYVLISDASVKTILLDPRGSVASVSDPGKILVGCTEAAFEFPKK